MSYAVLLFCGFALHSQKNIPSLCIAPLSRGGLQRMNAAKNTWLVSSFLLCKKPTDFFCSFFSLMHGKVPLLNALRVFAVKRGVSGRLR